MTSPDEFENAEKVSTELFLEIMKKTNGRIFLNGLSSWEINVVLAYHVLGLAGSMGLEEMLDDEMDEDPGYLKSIRAFREIGANEIAQILEEAISRKNSFASGSDTSSVRDFDALDADFYSRERKCVIQIGRYIAEREFK